MNLHHPIPGSPLHQPNHKPYASATAASTALVVLGLGCSRCGTFFPFLFSSSQTTSALATVYCMHACQVASVMSHSATPWTVACKAALCTGSCKQEYWSGLPCSPPENLPYPGIELMSLMLPALASGLFSASATWRTQNHWPFLMHSDATWVQIPDHPIFDPASFSVKWGCSLRKVYLADCSWGSVLYC